MGERMKICAVVVAGGQGTRLGDSIPKAFIDLGGKPLFLHSLSVLDSHPTIESVVLVVPQERMRETASLAAEAGANSVCAVVAGGEERWHSVRNGVKEAPEQCDTVLIHDAARPFVTHAVIDAIIDKAQSYQSVITATPVVDTIRRFEDDRAGETVDRSSLVRVGTPQLFRIADLMAAFDKAEHMAEPPTDEAVLMQKLGFEVGIAWGDPLNFKITTTRDLELARKMIADPAARSED
jgi:2-C-methyl-D-erythritol 4-phosphate cytidylyltransferase